MDGTLLLSLATLGTGFLALVIKYGFKSKCSDVAMCWGCCKIHRDIENEIKAEEIELAHNVNTETDAIKPFI